MDKPPAFYHSQAVKLKHGSEYYAQCSPELLAHLLQICSRHFFSTSTRPSLKVALDKVQELHCTPQDNQHTITSETLALLYATTFSVYSLAMRRGVVKSSSTTTASAGQLKEDQVREDLGALIPNQALVEVFIEKLIADSASTKKFSSSIKHLPSIKAISHRIFSVPDTNMPTLATRYVELQLTLTTGKVETLCFTEEQFHEFRWRIADSLTEMADLESAKVFDI